MSTKSEKPISVSVQQETWFIAQCLVRNPRYLVLYQRHSQLWKVMERLMAPPRQLPAGPRSQILKLLWSGDLGTLSTTRALAKRVDTMSLSGAQLGALSSALDLSSIRGAAGARIEKWILEARFRQRRNPTADAERRQRRIEREIHDTFGLEYPIAPSRILGRSPEEISWMREFLPDAINLLDRRRKRLARVDSVGERPLVGLDLRIRSDAVARLSGLVEDGRYIYFVVDAHQRSDRIRHDFERAMTKIALLRRHGKLSSPGHRARPDVWPLYLEIWDLESSGAAPEEFIRAIRGARPGMSHETARVQSDRYRTRVKRFMTEAWWM